LTEKNFNDMTPEERREWVKAKEIEEKQKAKTRDQKFRENIKEAVIRHQAASRPALENLFKDKKKEKEWKENEKNES